MTVQESKMMRMLSRIFFFCTGIILIGMKPNLHKELSPAKKSYFNKMLDIKTVGLGGKKEACRDFSSIDYSNTKHHDFELLIESLYWLAITASKGDALTPLEIKLRSTLKITKLDLSNNYFASLPDSLQECEHLEEFIAHHNKLTIIPSFLGKMSMLKKVDLSHNAICNARKVGNQSLDDMLWDECDLSHNYIKKTPFLFEKSSSMNIILKGNPCLKKQHKTEYAFKN